MLAAAVALADAAVARITSYDPPVASLLLWLSPVLVVVALDVYTRRRVHPATAISLCVLVLGYSRIYPSNSEVWMDIARALLPPSRDSTVPDAFVPGIPGPRAKTRYLPRTADLSLDRQVITCLY